MAVTLCECYFFTKMQCRRKVSRFQDVPSLEAMRSERRPPQANSPVDRGYRSTGELAFRGALSPMDSKGILDAKGRFQWLLML